MEKHTFLENNPFTERPCLNNTALEKEVIGRLLLKTASRESFMRISRARGKWAEKALVIVQARGKSHRLPKIGKPYNRKFNGEPALKRKTN